MPAVPRPVTLGLEPSFGFGDRLGLATPGHLAALRAEGGRIRPIFAQQSIREMTRTQRSATEVMSTAVAALQQAKFVAKWGADADHLKTEADAAATVAAGFTFFTIDPSEHVDPHADDYDSATLQTKFAAVLPQIEWIKEYSDRTIKVQRGLAIKFDPPTLQRAVVKYGRAIVYAVKLASYIQFISAKAGQECEIELSVDETSQPTTPAEHYLIADQCLKNGMKLVSLALRFVGDFEKGVDYKGDIETFTRSLKVHATLARKLGPYKLSLHSGSDKLAIYEIFARATKGKFHVKTAGASYLEAVRVVARHEPGLFRRIVEFARSRYDTDKATYHVSATVQGVPGPARVADNADLEKLYLESWSDVPAGQGFTNPGRQILHCTFGSTLTDPTLGPALKAVVQAHPETYRDVLADHFGRHLAALRRGL